METKLEAAELAFAQAEADIQKTGATEKGQGFTQEDLDNNLTACTMGKEESVRKGVYGDRLLGKVVWVSQELQEGTTIPALCAVQARGMAEFKFESPLKPNDAVCINGEGRVCYQDDEGDGYVTIIRNEEQTAEIWLG